MTKSGDRHLRKDPLGKFDSTTVNKSAVRVVINNNISGLYTTQHLAQMLVNLLARQYEIIDEIIISCPTETLALPGCFHPSKDPSGSLPLSEKLLQLVHQIGGIEITGRYELEDDETLPTVFIGSPIRKEPCLFSINVACCGWEFFVSTQRLAPSCPDDSKTPIGPYLAASYATSAIFHHLHGIDASTEIFFDAWNFKNIENFSGFNSPEEVFFHPAYVVGLGAVGGAFAFTLASMPCLNGDLIFIDDDTASSTNRNRLLLMHYNDVDQYKVELASNLFHQSKIKTFDNKLRWPEYTLAPDRKRPESVKELEGKYQYRTIISCVDKNIHRRNIAKFLPLNVIGGSTYGTTAQVCYYCIDSPYECLSCSHPVPEVPPTEEMRQMLLLMSVQERLEWYQRFDLPSNQAAAIEEYINEPSCGKIGKNHLEKIGHEGEPDWSVGFASIAAGVLLAAAFIRFAVEDSITFKGQNQFFAWFQSGLGSSVALKDPSCELCSAPDTISRFKRKWARFSG